MRMARLHFLPSPAAPRSRPRIGRQRLLHRKEPTDMRVAWIAIAALGLAGVVYTAEKPVYVTAEKVSGHIGFYDANHKVLKEVSVGGHPHELAFSPDGRYVYCTDNGV